MSMGTMTQFGGYIRLLGLAWPWPTILRILQTSIASGSYRVADIEDVLMRVALAISLVGDRLIDLDTHQGEAPTTLIAAIVCFN